MLNTFSIEQVQNTPTYKALEAKKEMAKMNSLETRNARATMMHAFCVFKNQGVIPTTVWGHHLEVVKDFINLSNIEVK